MIQTLVDDSASLSKLHPFVSSSVILTIGQGQTGIRQLFKLCIPLIS